ncbi:MAG: flavin reductase [Oscillospiraceae bacterium]|nr:flavin reductase [Oscillospiraceae bacterium]
MKNFIQIKPEFLSGNVFDLIGRNWMLITAKHENHINAMTASWGGLASLWNKNVAFFFIRPQRHTFSIVENTKFITLCFLDTKNNKNAKNILNFCGRTSGKDVDKVKETGMTVLEDENFTYFEESSLVLCCKKLYGQFLTAESFCDKSIILENYKKQDFHKMFVGEMVKILKSEV